MQGWDDPRMPTIAAPARHTPKPSGFRDRIGVAKRDSVVDIGLLEHCLREDLNKGTASDGGLKAAQGGPDQLSRVHGMGKYRE